MEERLVELPSRTQNNLVEGGQFFALVIVVQRVSHAHFERAGVGHLRDFQARVFVKGVHSIETFQIKT